MILRTHHLSNWSYIVGRMWTVILPKALERRLGVESCLVSVSCWSHLRHMSLARLPKALERRWEVEAQNSQIFVAISESPDDHCSVGTLIVMQRWQLIVATELPYTHRSVGTLVVTCHWQLANLRSLCQGLPGDYACACAHVAIYHWRYVNRRRRRWAHNLR